MVRFWCGLRQVVAHGISYARRRSIKLWMRKSSHGRLSACAWCRCMVVPTQACPGLSCISCIVKSFCHFRGPMPVTKDKDYVMDVVVVARRTTSKPGCPCEVSPSIGRSSSMYLRTGWSMPWKIQSASWLACMKRVVEGQD